MAIENTVSRDSDPRSSIVKSVFDCRKPGVVDRKTNPKGRISSPSFQASLCSALSLLERHLPSAVSLCKRFGSESGPIERRS